MSAVYMDRMTEDSLVLMQNTANLSEQLNAEDFDFSWNTGLDVSLLRRRWDDNAMELRYLDLGQLHADAFVLANANNLVFNSMPPVFFPNVQSIDSRYTSEVRSFEANYHFAVYDTIHYLAGFRYVGLHDDLTAILDANPQAFLYRATTRNNLYGAQVGVLGFQHGPICRSLWTSAFAKIGVFGNDARHQSLIDTGVARLTVDDSDGNASWVGELGFVTQLPVTSRLSIHGGYSMLWLERIAIASDQMQVSDFFNSTGSDNRGDAIFHGAHVGIELLL